MKSFRHFVTNLVIVATLVITSGMLQIHSVPSPTVQPTYTPSVELPVAIGNLPTPTRPSPPVPVQIASHNQPLINAPVAKLVNQPVIASHPNYKYTALLSNSNPLYAMEPYLSRVSAQPALSYINGNNAISPIIAVIDTGFALNHQNLTERWFTDSTETGATNIGSAQSCSNQGLTLDKRCNNIDNNGDGYPSNWRGWDFVHSDNNPIAGRTDPNGGPVFHGTMTASLAAVLNPNAKIMPLQALDDDGVGYTDTVAAAVTYAADHGANIISLSLGSSSDDSYLRSQIDYAIAKGVVVVAAAGNNGCDCLSYPAAYPEVLSVGATDSTDHLASFSSYGYNLDVVAPGTAGDTCGAMWSASNTTSGYSCSYSGTSFATPLVASLVSLMISQDPSASPSDIMRFITSSADKLAGMGGSPRTSQYGYGRINAYQAVLAASLAGPGGEVINKTTASLSSTDLTTGPLLDSACQGIPGANCKIELISSDGHTIINLGSQQLDQYGSANFIWNAATVGLTPDRWRVQSTITALGQSATGQTAYLTISP